MPYRLALDLLLAITLVCAIMVIFAVFIGGGWS